ncbi:MAG: hypothetical protein Q8900_02850 [Bacillota bacterium]|nr:hypothetical protein [Bacillota bacterium]
MAIRINNLTVNLDEDISIIKMKAAKILKISESDIDKIKIIRESIDARKKDNIKFNYSVDVFAEKEDKIVSKCRSKDVILSEKIYSSDLKFGDKKMLHKPIIVGMGPAGMFAGLLLARNGYKPLIVERGQNVDERTETVNKFWKDGTLNLNSNVQFGEGGAGTFSDGKLTTRIKDHRCDFILEELVKKGSPEEIIYSGKPHIGTDILKKVVKNIREEIISLGGEVQFNSTFQSFTSKDKRITSAVVNCEEIPCEAIILAIGHSSRDTYEMLYNKNVFMSPKDFAIGVRIEHLREKINESQYGRFANHPKLKTADYRLVHKSEIFNRGIYSFCMCPGGEVVAAASEDSRLVTNGMSYYNRNMENSNSALVVTVNTSDFDNIPDFSGNNILKGMEFQRYYESLAFKAGGGNYIAPIQLTGDFLKDKVSSKLGNVNPSYKPGYEFRNLNECLPSYVTGALKEGILIFDKKLKGFADVNAVMTGIESRTSAPVRIERNEKLQSVSFSGLYPAGEGAGFAGGIVSAAVDGIKAAESIMEEWKPIY